MQDTQKFKLPIYSLLITVLCVACSQHITYAPVRSTQHQSYKSQKAKYYVVQTGDTLYAIGFRFGYGYQDLAAWNRISPPYEINAGQRLALFKPKNKTRIIYKENKKKPKPAKKKRNTSQKKPIVSSAKKKMLKLHWQWPIAKKIVKTFSQTGNKGINIKGRSGQKVRAAAAGKVVYSGDGLIGYGNLLIIKHNYLYLSAYANNRRLLVNEGQMVKKGQAIAEVGTGNGKKPILHFEIRKNGKPVNPVKYLPKH